MTELRRAGGTVGGSSWSEVTRGDIGGVNVLIESPLKRELNRFLVVAVEEAVGANRLAADILYHMRLDCPAEAQTVAHSKRLRGMLCLIVGEGAGVAPLDTLHIAAAIECYHNASLIIDDIQDGSPERCGREALWIRSGLARAINAAFLLKTLGALVLLGSNVNQRTVLPLALDLERVAERMVHGQTRDLETEPLWKCGPHAYWRTCELKTGELVAFACRAGLAHDCAADARDRLSAFGMALGVAHQLEDDLDDLVALADGVNDRVDAGNIANFLLMGGSAFRATRDLRATLLTALDESAFWERIAALRRERHAEVSKAILRLKGIISERAILTLDGIRQLLCGRNDHKLTARLSATSAVLPPAASGKEGRP